MNGSKFTEGQEVVLKQDLFYVKAEGGLFTKEELETNGYGVELYLKAGTRMKATSDGLFEDITFEGGDQETGLNADWIVPSEILYSLKDQIANPEKPIEVAYNNWIQSEVNLQQARELCSKAIEVKDYYWLEYQALCKQDLENELNQTK